MVRMERTNYGFVFVASHLILSTESSQDTVCIEL